MRVVLMVCVCWLLSACHADSEALTYHCDSGTVIAVSYEQDKAVLDYRGQAHTLVQAISASGARYRDDALEWWSKGDEATLFTDDHGNAGDILEQCKHASSP